MRVIFVTDRYRFWEHWASVVPLLREHKHASYVLIVPTASHEAPRGDELKSLQAELIVSYGSRFAYYDGTPNEVQTKIAELFGTWKPDIIVVCPEHLGAMAHCKALAARSLNPRPPVIAFQHGLSQRPGPETLGQCDFYFGWGPFSAQVLTGGMYPCPPIRIVGTDRFQSFSNLETSDEGFILALPGYKAFNTSWLGRAVQAAKGKRVVVKVHPNQAETPDLSGDEKITILPHNMKPYDLMRKCSAIYLEYLSTYILEAEAMGKPVILSDGPVRKMEFDRPHCGFLLRGKAAPRIVQALESILQTWSAR